MYKIGLFDSKLLFEKNVSNSRPELLAGAQSIRQWCYKAELTFSHIKPMLQPRKPVSKAYVTC